jgi:hypothetical protein
VISETYREHCIDVAHRSANEPNAAIPAEDGSSQSKKSKRGGKQPGADRKPNPVKILLKGVHRDTINAAIQDNDVDSVISQLLKSKREIIRLQTLNSIFDRLMGKPKQEVGISGGLAMLTRAIRV